MTMNVLAQALQTSCPSASSKLILISLAAKTGEPPETRTSVSALAAECNMTRRTVSRHIAALKDAGLIEVVHQFADDGGRAANLYRITLGDRA